MGYFCTFEKKRTWISERIRWKPLQHAVSGLRFFEKKKRKFNKNKKVQYTFLSCIHCSTICSAFFDALLTIFTKIKSSKCPVYCFSAKG